jgi:hypothetical protein
MVLLRDLKDYNDGLEQLFPPSRLATLERTVSITRFLKTIVLFFETLSLHIMHS